jgi:ubiquinone biosynthesis monooxygenase Coq7
MANLLDDVLGVADRALRTMAGAGPQLRASPGANRPQVELAEAERAQSAALMRVNHVGEICAQALYEAQAIGSADPLLRLDLRQAALDESDHLAWTRQRIEELGGRTSLLNPFWYAGAFGIGLVAALGGDKISLGFIAETERQVCEHLQGHLDRLPAADQPSRAIVAQMQQDEARHGSVARELGGIDLPWPVKIAMRIAAKAMTATAYRI